MNNRQFFILVLALVYYLMSLALLLIPLLYSKQQAELLQLYPDIPSLPTFFNLVFLLLTIHILIIASLVFTALKRKRTGLWMLIICGGIWLALQFTRDEGLNLLRPVAEIVVLALFILVFGVNRAKEPLVKVDHEVTENEQQTN